MTENTDRNPLPTPAQLLDREAEQLAAQHRQRLHQMTRAAVYGRRQERRRHAFGLWPAAVPVLSVLIAVLVWQLRQQPGTAPDTPLAMRPSQPAKLADPVPAEVPAWVRDTDVPVAVIENVEFYQWLAKELNDEDHS